MEALVRALLAGMLAGALALSPTRAAKPAATVTPQPAAAYVLVTTADQYGWLPLAQPGEEYDYPLYQTDADGQTLVNVLQVTDHSVWMAEANCPNHDCVEQGEVSLENRDSRVLSNMIFCLPNHVSLALYTPEEILALYGDR